MLIFHLDIDSRLNQCHFIACNFPFIFTEGKIPTNIYMHIYMEIERDVGSKWLCLMALK